MELPEYFARLQQTMQQATEAAEQLQQAARHDLEAAADWRIKTQELLHHYEQTAHKQAVAEVDAWMAGLWDLVLPAQDRC